MAAVFRNHAIIQHGDLVRHAHGGEAMTDEQRRLLRGQRRQAFEDLGLGLCIHGRSGLIQDEQIRVLPHQRAAQGDLLPLPTTQFTAPHEEISQLCAILLRPLIDEGRRHALLRGTLQPRLLLDGVDVAHSDVLSHRQLVTHEVLKDGTAARLQRLRVPFSEIPSIQQNPALVGLVQSSEQLDQGGLSSTIVAHQREARARWNVESHALDRVLRGAGVAEPDLLEAQAVPRAGAAGGGAACGLHLVVQEFVEIRQVQVVRVHSADGAKDGGEGLLTLLEDQQIHGHISQADLLPHRRQRHPGEGRVEPGGADEFQEETVGALAQGQIGGVLEEGIKDAAVTFQKPRAQPKKLHLFGGRVHGHDPFQVDLLPKSGGLPSRQLKGVAGELHARDEGRNGGDDQHRHGHGREAQQQGSVAQQCQGVSQQTQ
mmetsp:Transcript_38976/g.83897  ORF Transcript_38976/g.83897 Transcript_38976/m.83897 type:complete len:428 (+) Transcript_38976:123-1406(+)